MLQTLKGTLLKKEKRKKPINLALSNDSIGNTLNHFVDVINNKQMEIRGALMFNKLIGSPSKQYLITALYKR